MRAYLGHRWDYPVSRVGKGRDMMCGGDDVLEYEV